MKKTLIWIVAIIIILWIAFYLYWLTVPRRISAALSSQMKVKVAINDIGLGTGTLTVNGFKVGNTPGSILPSALEINTVTIKAPVTHYVQDPLIIDHLVLDDIYLGLEFDSATSSKGNWTKIISNMKKSEAASRAAAPKTSKQRIIKIKTVTLMDIKVEMVFRSGDQRVKKLAPIKQLEFYNISTEGDQISEAIMDSVVVQMLEQIFIKENIKNMLKDVINIPGGAMDKVLSPLDGLFK